MAAQAASSAASGNVGQEGDGEEGEQQLDDFEPRVAWCQNAPLLYDLFIGVTLEWPALAIAWLPDEPNAERCRLALGMHTDGSMPHELVVVELTCSAEETIDADPWHSVSVDGLGDIEAFGCSAESDCLGPLRTVARMAHPTEVNRVAPCPSRPQLLATKAATGAVLLFDYKAERPSGQCCPDATLAPSGQVADGFALQWSFLERRLLASGGNDGRLCLWDVEVSPKARAGAPLLDLQEAHKGPLCGVAFSRSEPLSLCSVGDDGFLRLWDLRQGSSPGSVAGGLRCSASVSGDEVLCVDWSRHQERCVATAGKDREVHVWDLRMLQAPLHSLRGHKGDVVAVWWAPFREGLLASCSTDNRVHLWDLAARTAPEDSLDDADASPELLFAHAGHQQGVSDFGWSDMDDYLLCSVSEDNSLQIWQPSAELYLPDAGAGEGAEDEEDNGPAAKRPRPAGEP